MKISFTEEEGDELLKSAVRAAVPIPPGYCIGAVERLSAYSNAFHVTLEKVPEPGATGGDPV